MTGHEMKAIRWSHILDGSDVMNRPGYGELLTLTPDASEDLFSFSKQKDTIIFVQFLFSKKNSFNKKNV